VRELILLRHVAIIAAVCVLGTAREGAAQQPGQASMGKKVILIGIDGVRPDALAEVPTPNIDALIVKGAFSDRARTGLPTVSGPGWSSMLIGVWPEKHGVLNNNFRTNRYGEFPDFLTRIEQTRPELSTFVVADWMPLVAENAGGPLFGEAPDVKIVLNGYELGWAEADRQSVMAAVEYLETAEPDAMFVYLGNPDETSHEARSIGDEYRDAIALADRHVGLLADAIRARPTYAEEDWLILVCTDHGRRPDGGHGGDSEVERTIFYLASGPSAVQGTLSGTPEIVDIAVTALTHLGIEIDPAWKLDGRAVGLSR
jgi:predicted AlkP superfamily pyrophosphatase or phosphodiesterase